MPDVSRELLNEEVTENHSRHFVPYAKSLLFPRRLIGLSEEDVCQTSYMRITDEIGEKLLLRKLEQSRVAIKLLTSETYPLRYFIRERIRLVIGDEYKRQVTRRKRRETLAGGKEHFEQAVQQSSISYGSANSDFQDYLETRLTDEERFVLLEKRVLNHSYQDIADMLNLSVNEVKKIEASAIQKLRRDMKD